jgi:chromosome segregation ATPase
MAAITTDNLPDLLEAALAPLRKELDEVKAAVKRLEGDDSDTTDPTTPDSINQLLKELKKFPKKCREVQTALVKCEEDAPLTRKDIDKILGERRKYESSSKPQTSQFDFNAGAQRLTNAWMTSMLAMWFPLSFFARPLD